MHSIEHQILGINLMNDMQGFYSENGKILLCEIKDLSKDILYLWIESFKNFKISNLPKLIRFNIIPIKILVFLVEIDKIIILKSI